MSGYLSYFPKPLLNDLVAGRWLPVVGAGMSRNAVLPAGGQIPLWDNLGKSLAEDMPDYPYAGALDSISAYSHEYSRSKLVERLAELLFVDLAAPGTAHAAFCSIPFDIVCTTNFDFLLERQYEMSYRYCRPMIDEEQLSIASKNSGVSLLKLHGDLHHPQRLVATEEDYDEFLQKYPLIATYLANLLITRTAVFVGYSLDDPDFRQIWQAVSDRLGKSHRLGYAIMVDPRATDVARFERRGVKVIDLPSKRLKYGEVLARVFQELRDYLHDNLIAASEVTEEDPLKELSLPREALTRLCFFAVPFALQSFYREELFPLAERHGFVPVTADDVVSPGDNIMAKIDTLIERSGIVVVDATTSNTLMEVRIALGKDKVRRVLAIFEKGATLPFNLPEVAYIQRPTKPFSSSDRFLMEVDQWFAGRAEELGLQLTEEPQRLFRAREYRAAVISAMTLLETTLRTRLEEVLDLPNLTRHGRVRSLPQLLDLAVRHKLIDRDGFSNLREWVNLRNAVVHHQQSVTKSKAREVIDGVSEVLGNLS